MQSATIKAIALLGVAAGSFTPAGAHADDLHPIVDFHTGYLLGGSAGGKWIKAEKAVRSLKGQEKYRVYSLHRFLGHATGSKPVSLGAPCPKTLFAIFAPSSKTPQLHQAMAKQGALGGAGNWNALPRVPRIASTTQPVYRQIVATILKQKGIAKPNVKITQLLRVDLEGDGVDEVLASATHHRGHPGSPGSISSDARSGEYSLVLLRQIVKGKVRTSVIAGEYYPHAKEFSAPSIYKIAAVLDVNGDGKMEIVVQGRYYEGHWMTIYRATSDKIEAVLSAGCGA